MADIPQEVREAAEIAEDAHNATGLRWTPKAIAQAIRSEANAQSPASPQPDQRAGG